MVGQRGGKSFISAVIGVFLACFFAIAQYLATGERCVVLILADAQRRGSDRAHALRRRDCFRIRPRGLDREAALSSQQASKIGIVKVGTSPAALADQYDDRICSQDVNRDRIAPAKAERYKGN